LKFALDVIHPGNGVDVRVLMYFSPDCLKNMGIVVFWLGAAGWEVILFEPADRKPREYKAIACYNSHARPLFTDRMTNADWQAWFAKIKAVGKLTVCPRVGWASLVEESRKLFRSTLRWHDLWPCCSEFPCATCNYAERKQDAQLDALFLKRHRKGRSRFVSFESRGRTATSKKCRRAAHNVDRQSLAAKRRARAMCLRSSRDLKFESLVVNVSAPV